jgi:hypothetical protein
MGDYYGKGSKLDLRNSETIVSNDFLYFLYFVVHYYPIRLYC